MDLVIVPYAIHVISLIEDALSEVFQYHEALDTFLRRCEISEGRISMARAIAERRAASSTRRYARAPKRFFVQALLTDLDTTLPEDARLFANIITALSKGRFKDASENAIQSIEALRLEIDLDRQRAEEMLADTRAKEREVERSRDNIMVARIRELEKLKQEFLQLLQESNPQSRGYSLEKFLESYFSFEGLEPRRSFKLLGEQIDGSFSWADRTHLVEAKWVASPVDGAVFSTLMYKIEGKSVDTRGLFVAINGYSQSAIEGLKFKGQLRFVCLDGSHLMRTLDRIGNFSLILAKVWRHANETGEAYLPVSSERFGDLI